MIYFIKFWKIFGPILATFYLLGHFFQFTNESAFEVINKIFGFFPKIINNIFYINVHWNFTDKGAGYFITALLITISVIIALKLQKTLESSVKINQKTTKRQERKKAKEEEKIIAKTQEETSKATKDKGFCGLFELKISCLNPQNTYNPDDIEKLKKEYLKMLTKKMKEMYPKIKFAGENRVFFFSNEFLIFNDFINCLLQIYQIFEEIDKQKNIKTDFLLSFADILEINNSKLLFKFLAKANELNNLNRIIVFDKFSRKYDYEKNKIFDYIWLDDIAIELENDVSYEGGYGYLEKIN